LLLSLAETSDNLEEITIKAKAKVFADFETAKAAADPHPSTLYDHIEAPTPITEEKGERTPEGKEPIMMVDAALFAVEEIIEETS